jgi:hypothetical protein
MAIDCTVVSGFRCSGMDQLVLKPLVVAFCVVPSWSTARHKYYKLLRVLAMGNRLTRSGAALSGWLSAWLFCSRKGTTERPISSAIVFPVAPVLA